MGKLSNILLKSLLFGAAKAQNDTFDVTNCNPDESHPHGIYEALVPVPKVVANVLVF